MKACIEDLVNQFKDRVKLDQTLGPYTTFKIGGPADIFFDAHSVDEVIASYTTGVRHGIPVSVLGGGTNVLIGDKGVRGLVIKNSADQIRIRGTVGGSGHGSTKQQVYVEAEAGASMNRLVRYAIEEGLQGIEMHLGLPGSVGGALYMNSKWTKPVGYVGDVVYKAELLTSQGVVREVMKDYFQFGYDTSILQKTNEIVLRVLFVFTKADKDALWKQATQSIGYRRESQPQGVFSAGCTFKNTANISAGYLVDQVGLKGLVIGDAMISPVHANFIVNRGKATAHDVVQLVRRAKEQVKHKFGVDLEEEIQYVGEF